jgi:predicted NUDIX family NTP pyrophosphohydrolase
MAKVSAGLLVHRSHLSVLEVFLIHPGGPLWAKKDAGAWSIPKGEIDGNEEALAAARREFREETGQDIAGQFRPLPTIKQTGGKVVHAWAVEGNCDADAIRSSTFEMEWPPKSGRIQSFPEVDRAAWFTLEEARERILKSQLPLLDALEQLLR